MNALAKETQLQIAHMLAEGCSIRSIERLTGVHRDTIMRLLVRVGAGCRDFLDARQRGLTLRHIQVDEIWTFVRKKQGRIHVNESDRRIGDQYLWLAFDEDTKLILTYAIGKRTGGNCQVFIDDVARRVHHDLQVSTDGFRPYREAVEFSFAHRARHGVMIKEYRNREQPGRYGPPELIATSRIPIDQTLDPNEICTSHVERCNLTVRTFIKRFARLSLGFSKKLENLAAAVALYVGYYNFCKLHRSLNGTPAMAAGLAGHPWTLAELLEAR